MGRHNTPRYTREREVEKFWQRVAKSDGCWEWTAGVTGVGRGHMQWRGRQVLAYRISWELESGTPPPVDMYVCHHCDNGLCVRPSHLFLGDALTNHLDAQRKGRLVPPPKHVGETHPRARYSDEFVRNARVQVEFAGPRSFAVVARQLGVSRILLRKWVVGECRLTAGGPLLPGGDTPTPAELEAAS